MPKGFQKGNKLGHLQKGKPKFRTQQWDNFGVKYLSEFTGKYVELMNKLSNGDIKGLTPGHLRFMEEFKDLLEYFRPKLARTELTGQDGGPIDLVTIIHQAANERNSTGANDKVAK